MSLRYHFSAEERAAYGARCRARRAAYEAAHPVEAAARRVTQAAEQAERERRSNAMVEAILAGPRVCLGWELVDGRVARHMVGESQTCERCAAVQS